MPRAARRASPRSSAPRRTWRQSRATSDPVRRGRVDDTGGDAEGGKLYYHLTLLAESNVGYANLMKLSSAAFLEGYYYKPRVDWELLERYHEGLIATSGCLGGVVLQSLLADDDEGALRRPRASRTSSAATASSSSCRITASTPSARRTPSSSTSHGPCARRCSPRTTATTRTARTRRRTTRSCASRPARCSSDEKRFRFEGTEHYLKSAAEMRHLFSRARGACDNTLLIAERVNVEIEFGRPSLPELAVPARITGATYEARAAVYLRELSYEGASSATATRCPTWSASASTTSSASSRRWGSRRTSSSCGTSSAMRASRGSASDPAGARPRRAASRSASGSSTSTRCATTCCSSAS